MAYVRSGLEARVREDLAVFVEMMCETLVLEAGTQTHDKFFMVIVYKPPSMPNQKFLELIETQLEKIPVMSGLCSFIGDFNLV